MTELLTKARGAAEALIKAIPPNTAWVQAAHELGFEVKIGLGRSQVMRGNLDGIGVIVDHVNRRNSRFLQYQVRHTPSGPPVELQRDTPLRKVERFLGRGMDVEIGDPLFDDRIMVQTAHRDQLRTFLTPARRAALLHLFEQNKDCIVRNNTIAVYQQGIEFQAMNLVQMVRSLVAVAKIMEHPDPLNAALTQQEAGNLAAATADLHVLNQQNHNPFTTMLEAHDQLGLGDHEQATALYNAVEKTPFAKGWADVARSEPPPPPTTRRSSSIDQQEAIDDLFDGSLASYSAVERFEQTYANRAVSWTGEVERFHSYRHDGDFGAGPGVKIVVLLGGAGRSKLISNEVRAVVQAPPGVVLRSGTPIDFSGTLIRIDRFARNLYVADATVAY